MPRRPRLSILSVMTVLSANLAVLAAVVWAASLLAGVRFDYAAIDRSADPVEVATIPSVALAPHQLRFGLTRYRMDRGRSLVTLDTYIPRGLTWQRTEPNAADRTEGRRLLPAVRHWPTVDTGFGDRSAALVAVPLWPIVVIGCVLPAVRLRRWWARRGWSATACAACGYDLRGSPGKCPECGAVTRPSLTRPLPTASP